MVTIGRTFSMRSLAATAFLACVAAGCAGPTTEDRARAAAADIEASIKDYDGPALSQEVDRALVKEVQTNLATLKEYMGEIDGKIDPVLINSIQAFQRKQNEALAWWQFWMRRPNDGLITDDLRAEIQAAAS